MKRKRNPNTWRTCRHEGCEQKLYKGCTTYDAWLCKDHGDRKVRLVPRLAIPDDPPVERPDVRVVEVAYPTGFSGTAGTAKVSLSREPWL
jgi:hypothetical protein